MRDHGLLGDVLDLRWKPSIDEVLPSGTRGSDGPLGQAKEWILALQILVVLTDLSS